MTIDVKLQIAVRLVLLTIVTIGWQMVKYLLKYTVLYLGTVVSI